MSCTRAVSWYHTIATIATKVITLFSPDAYLNGGNYEQYILLFYQRYVNTGLASMH